MFTTLFEDGSLQEYINQNAKDPWVGTPFEGYVHMSPKQKGEFGERFVSKFFTNVLLCNVKRAKTSTAGHDRVIDDILTEIKFSLATRDKKGGVKADQFIINHVSKDKDWERLVFFGINEKEEDCRFFWFTKEDFLKHLESEENCFAAQQGGKSIGNDDFICTKVSSLLECSFVKSVTEW
jgi:hypothetical protein